MSIQDTRVLVLPDETSARGKGGLFERFIAKLLADTYGFSSPTTRSLNVTSEGIELDVVAQHKLTGAIALAECKAYERNVKSAELMAFYGKLGVERFKKPHAFGVFCALPRLTPDGEEKARSVVSQDAAFKYLCADDIALALLTSGLIADPPASLTDISDRAVVITEHGVFASCIVLDSTKRTPTGVAVWGVTGSVPDIVRQLLSNSDYANGLLVSDSTASPHQFPAIADRQPTLLTAVVGSSSDFEYQLPASPKFFVGRRGIVNRLTEVLNTSRGNVVVLNAQSGWGKSSLALKLKEIATRQRGIAHVLDTRTASNTRYVVEVLRKSALDAQAAGILSLPESASWGSLDSALGTLRSAQWNSSSRPIVIFFDQFENIFRNVDMTRAFRDLSLGAREVPGPLVVGFAWKTDLVGWTEGHPFRLRDDIRGAGTVITVDPFGASEVDVILARLAKEAGVRLHPDFRSRLRAYSQGLPWLLKKLADHVLREFRNGETQEGLLAESLNVGALFEADLAELVPSEQALIRHVARYAPIPAIEATERFGPEPVQSLVDRRLIVQVGDRLDTYWDTFRDFLNTGEVPVQESWVLRQTPLSVGRLLVAVVDLGCDASIQDLTHRLETSDRAIWNLARELRLLGVTARETNRVRLVDEVVNADDREQELRKRVGASLRRHRAYSTLRNLAERSGERITLETYARDLPSAFPAVEVSDSSWRSYARAFIFWMEYAGLVTREGTDYLPTAEPTIAPTVLLLDARSPLRYRPSVPQIAPRRAIDLLERLYLEGEIDLPVERKDREAVGALYGLRAVSVSPERKVRISVPDLYDDAGHLNRPALRRVLAGAPGGASGLAVIESDSRATPEAVGIAIAEVSHPGWSTDWLRQIGGYFRAWAKVAGLPVDRPRRECKATDAAQIALPVL